MSIFYIKSGQKVPFSRLVKGKLRKRILSHVLCCYKTRIFAKTGLGQTKESSRNKKNISVCRYGGYEDALFEQQVLRTVAEHDPKTPYFLFWAPHIGAGTQYLS